MNTGGRQTCDQVEISRISVPSQQFDQSFCVAQYTEQLKELRQAAEDDIEVAKRRDGLEDMKVDITSIKPKFA